MSFNASDSVSPSDNLSYLNSQGPIKPVLIKSNRSPTPNDRRYKVGTLWLNEALREAFILGGVAQGVADWLSIGSSTASAVNQLTPDVGVPVTPISGNVNVVGTELYETSGSGDTLTVTPRQNGYPITPYVVGIAGVGGYGSVQAAIDAASAAGGGTVYITPGTYVEDLTLAANVDLWGAVGIADTQVCVIEGVHTPPPSGDMTVRNIFLRNASDIFNSAAAGTGSILLIDCAVDLTSGFVFNIPNWTGGVALFDLGAIGSTNDGFINNTAGASLFATNATIGAGSVSTAQISGPFEIYNCVVNCPLEFLSSSSGIIAGGSLINNSVTFSGSSTANIYNSTISSGANPSITQSSTGDISLASVVIDSTTPFPIDGLGSGRVDLTSVSFPNMSGVGAALTVTSGDIRSGNTIYQSGEGPVFESGGTGDRAGTGTFVGGVAVIANTSVTANSLVFVTVTNDTPNGPRPVNVTNIIPGVSFQVNSRNGTDASSFNYLIVEAP